MEAYKFEITIRENGVIQIPEMAGLIGLKESNKNHVNPVNPVKSFKRSSYAP